MTINTTDVLRYWRTSLADSALGEGKFTQSDRQRFLNLSAAVLRTGVLAREDLDWVFKDQAAAKSVAVRFWPLVMARKLSHGAARGGRLPEIVAPVVSEATVARDGQITRDGPGNP